MFPLGKRLEKMLKPKSFTRIPLPALRVTFPPGEGIARRMGTEKGRFGFREAKRLPYNGCAAWVRRRGAGARFCGGAMIVFCCVLQGM